MKQSSTQKSKKSIAMANLFPFDSRKRHVFISVLIGVLTFLIIYAIMLTAVTPKRYDLAEGDIAPESIPAPRDIEDKRATEEKINEAVDQVPDFYTLDQKITNSILGEIEAFFLRIDDIRNEITEDIYEYSMTYGGPKPGNGTSMEDLLDSWLKSDYGASFKDQLNSQLPIKLDDEDIIVMVLSDKRDLDELNKQLSTYLSGVLKDGIKTEQVDEYKENIDALVQNMDIPEDVKALGIKVGVPAIKANMLYDPIRTTEEKEKAADKVEKVMLRKGQFIVQEGQPVTEYQIELLKDLGLIKDDYIDIPLFVGIALIIIFTLGLIIAYLVFFEKKIVDNIRDLLLISTVICLVLFLSYITSYFNKYFIPVAMGGMLLTILLNSRTGIIVNVVLAILAGLLLEMDLGVVIVALVGGMTGICLVRNMESTNTLVRSGFGLSVVNMLVVTGYEMITTGEWASTGTLWGVAGGMLAVILAIGFLPFLENIFGILTSVKLIEIANPNHPAMKRLLMEASGTYHHSVIVGNLAENAADAVNANGLLARVGAYYHDLGKLRRPYFFKENQLYSDNPHDKMDPIKSAKIITGHPQDGVEIAKKYKVPAQIYDFMLQHHGTTPVIYFYHKAKNKYGEHIKLEDFRYKGPKPQTKEAAIIMMADTVEAAVRSLDDHSKEKVDGLIRKLIKEKLDDGQFNDCELTLNDLDKIAEAFLNVLVGIFHERVSYPDVSLNDEKEQEIDDAVN